MKPITPGSGLSAADGWVLSVKSNLPCGGAEYYSCEDKEDALKLYNERAALNRLPPEDDATITLKYNGCVVVETTIYSWRDWGLFREGGQPEEGA